MGRRLFEFTLPKVADELARLDTNLEALIALGSALRAPNPTPPSADAIPAGDSSPGASR